MHAHTSIKKDFKFETDPYDVQLHGLLTPEQYTEAMENLNLKLRSSRAGFVDGVLLATGPLLVPLALWGVRHRNQTKRRKRLLKEGIHEFNMQYEELLMRWNRRPAQSVLTIEQRNQGIETAHNERYFDDRAEVTVQATLCNVDFDRPQQSHPPLQQSATIRRQQQQQQQQSVAPTATAMQPGSDSRLLGSPNALV